MDIAAKIEGSEKLTSVFGRWPRFHDAEVVWLKLDRALLDEAPRPTLDVLIHAFEMTRDVDAAGYYVLRNHSLVHLRFRGVVDVKLGEFNHQNALFGLEIEEQPHARVESAHFAVCFDPANGLEGTFSCRSIECVSVAPCDEKGKPLLDPTREPPGSDQPLGS